LLISFESLWANLGSSSFFTAIVPIVLGGVLAYFKPWLPAEDDIRERSSLKRQLLLEEVNKRLQHLLSQLQVVGFNLEDLRGAPPAQPDLIADFTAEFIQAIEAAEKLRKIYVCVKACFTLFLITAVAGLVGLLVAFVVEGARQYVSIACYIVIAFQLVLILAIRRWMGRFEECERIV
jgi:hypothetical protein